MYDLHCHLLPAIDDGATDLAMSLEMARMAVADGITLTACTPHIYPGLYENTGPGIRAAIAALQAELDREGIALRLVEGADVHLDQGLVAGIRDGRVPTLAGSRYLLFEPPHHVAPARLEETLFELLAAGYVPVITHPERLTWVEQHCETFVTLSQRGCWIQVTAGALAGRYGRRAKHWGEKFVGEGHCHILATDAHHPARRPPFLAEAREALNPYPQWSPAMNGFFANPNHQATLLVVAATLACARLAMVVGAWQPGRPHRVVHGVVATLVMLLAAVALPLTGSRAGVVLLILSCALVVAAHWPAWRGGTRSRLVLVASMAIAAVALALALRWMQVEAIDELRGPLRALTGEIAARYAPMGAGMGSYVPLFEQDAPRELLMANYVNHAHNEYAQWWFAAGVPAVLAIALGALALALTLRGLLRQPPHLRGLGVTALVALGAILGTPGWTTRCAPRPCWPWRPRLRDSLPTRPSPPTAYVLAEGALPGRAPDTNHKGA